MKSKKTTERKKGAAVRVQQVVRARLRVNIKGAWSTWKRSEVVKVLACEIGKEGRRSTVMANVPSDALEVICDKCPNVRTELPPGNGGCSQPKDSNGK